MKWILALVPLSLFGQTITLTPIGNQDVSGIPVTVEHYVTTGNGNTTVKIFRTHYGNGNTSQYGAYPSTRTEMNRLFSTAFPGTTLWWTGNINVASSFNFTNYITLVNAGASIPNNGEFYTAEVTCTFVPLETGTYSFGLTSDDGGDLMVAGISVVEHYGAKGMGAYKYGNIYLTAGQQYTLVARMQEYGGGDGLHVIWKRPSQSNYTIQSTEIGVASSTWVNQGTRTTNATGVSTWSNPNNRPYRVTVDVRNKFHSLSDQDLLYMMFMKTFPGEMRDWDYFTCDCDNSSLFGWEDINFCYGLLSINALHNKYIFTLAEKLDIEDNYKISLYNQYPPRQIRVEENQNQFFIMGTGKHKTTTLMQKMQ